MSELTKRIALVIVTAPIFLGLLWLGDWPFKAMAIAIALFIEIEMILMLKKGGLPVFTAPAIVLGAVILLSPVITPVLPFFAVLFVWIIMIAIWLPNAERALTGVMTTLLVGTYAATGFLFLILIRDAGSSYAGFSLALTLILMVWASDIFAYFVGKNFGRRLMAPIISPKKTWEGTLGGAVGALIGLLFCYFVIPQYPYALPVLLPLILTTAIIGPIGDLAASRFKRVLEVKDSSGMLPGHGGFFDRFDSMVASVPAGYVYLFMAGIIT